LPTKAISAFFVEESTFFVTAGATVQTNHVQRTAGPRDAAGRACARCAVTVDRNLPATGPEFAAAHLELAGG
jgi:hypothetical protein